MAENSSSEMNWWLGNQRRVAAWNERVDRLLVDGTSQRALLDNGPLCDVCRWPTSNCDCKARS